jgi:hypothetical protein
MDFTELADLPIIDGHIHFAHPDLAGGLVSILDSIRIS